MRLFQAIKAAIVTRLQDIVISEVERQSSQWLSLIPQLIEYGNSKVQERQSYVDHTRTPLEDYDYFCRLRDQIASLGIKQETVSVDINNFLQWLDNCPEILDNYKNQAQVCIEKCLEYYLSFHYLDMSSSDIFIDVAAAGSPYVDMLKRRLGINAYCLDLCFPHGIHGRNIGADAGDTKLPTGFASALALHCAFECFMGDADCRFIQEASRILRPGGRYVITPLYLDETHFVATSPYCNQGEVLVDSGAVKVWRDDSYRVPFSRHYSPQAFFSRVYSLVPDDMEGKVLFIENLPELMEHFPGQRIYCYFVFLCRKKS